MLVVLVFLILLVLIAPALMRLAGALFLLWLCVTYWYIGIPLAALWLVGVVQEAKRKNAPPPLTLGNPCLYDGAMPATPARRPEVHPMHTPHHPHTTASLRAALIDHTIAHDGDTWRVLGVGAVNEAGAVYLHLASTTRARQQRNGACPLQSCDWLPLDALSPYLPTE